MPKIYVVRTDGEVLYTGPGKPRDMVDFLNRRLEVSGKAYVGAELAKLQRDLRSLKRLARRDRAAYVKLVTEYAAAESYAAPAVEIAAAADGLASDAGEELAAAADVLADPAAGADDRFDAVAALLELAEDYEPLPQTHRRIVDRTAAFENGEDGGDAAGILARVRLCRTAEAAADARDWAVAVATRVGLIADQPETEAARRAGWSRYTAEPKPPRGGSEIGVSPKRERKGATPVRI